MDKPSRGERTKNDIILSAGRLFSMLGYHQTSTSDILEAASISKGAFYHHFRSKEDLALSVLAQLKDDYQQQVIDQVISQAAPTDRPIAMLDRIIELNQSGQWYNCLLLAKLATESAQQETELSQQVADAISWLIENWRQLLSEAQSVGAINSQLEPNSTAELVVSAMMGATTCQELQNQPVNLTQTANQIKAIIQA